MNLSQKLYGTCALLWAGEAGFAAGQGSWLWFAFSVVLGTLYTILTIAFAE